MSKFWLLLLLVAAFQFARSYPAVEYEVDEYINDEADDYLSDEDTLGNVIQLTMSKLKDNYKTNDKNGTNKIVAIIRDKYCGLQEDFEDDYQSDETQDKVYYVYRLLQTFRKFYDKANDNWAQKEDKFNVALAILRKKFCVSLSSPLLESDYYEDADYVGGDAYFEDEGDDGDEERFKIKPGKVFDKFGKVVGKVLKQLKKVSLVAKLAMKKGAALLKKMGVKISPLKCEEKTCKSCVIFKIPTENSFCLTIRFMKTNIATYLVVAGEINRISKFEEKLKLGNMPRCVNAGGFLGKVCLKGIEGHAKSSSGQANVNFCLGVVAEKFGVGAKFCGVYANKKVRVKISPQLFPGATSVDGDIVKLDDNGEDATTLDVDEVEID